MPNNKTAAIRQEQPSDYKIIHKVVKKAFESTEHSDGNEQELVIMLRKSEAYIPELSLVAEIDSSIVGHIMFTRAKVGDKSVLALAPLSVLPEYQNKGIGKVLISAGHHTAKNHRQSIPLSDYIRLLRRQSPNSPAFMDIFTLNFAFCHA